MSEAALIPSPKVLAPARVLSGNGEAAEARAGSTDSIDARALGAARRTRAVPVAGAAHAHTTMMRVVAKRIQGRAGVACLIERTEIAVRTGRSLTATRHAVFSDEARHL